MCRDISPPSWASCPRQTPHPLCSGEGGAIPGNSMHPGDHPPVALSLAMHRYYYSHGIKYSQPKVQNINVYNIWNTGSLFATIDSLWGTCLHA